MVIELKKENYFHPLEFPISIDFVDNHPSFPLHTHEFSEIVIIRDGTGVHTTEEDSYLIEKGDAFIISGKNYHGYKHTHNLYVINIYFDLDHLHFDPQDLVQLGGYHAFFNLEPIFRKKHSFLSRMRLSDDDLAQITQICYDLKDEISHAQPGFRFITTALFMKLIGFLSRYYEKNVKHNTSEEVLRLGKAISYIETHYREPINLENIAKIANMSVRNFQRIFKLAMGGSPMKYLNHHIRIRKHACILLSKSDIDITDIAFKVGFNDSNYFSHIFHNVMGMTPSDYRRQAL